MINKLYVQGLKSIDKLELHLSNLNILAGTNSSGKSTVLQAILLAAQSFITPNKTLNGGVVSLGKFREVRNFNTNTDEITIKIVHSDAEYTIDYNENVDSGNEKLKFVDNCKPDLFISMDKLSIDIGVYYLAASRIGWKDTYDKNIQNVHKYGLNGEYCLDFFERHKGDILEDNLIKDEDSCSLEFQVNYWLNYIVGSKLATEDIKETDKLKAKFSSLSGRHVRTRNIGSGLSYIISILIMCLSMKKGNTIIIENPEIHLHPKAQSRLMEFFVFIAKSNRQIILETHSDHIFNGARVGIANGNIKKDLVTINFLEQNELHCTVNTVIDIGKRGRIENPPADLFDQFDLDLEKMLGL